MVKKFDPREYKDEYEGRLRAMLEARARGEAPKRPKTKAPAATNVVDLVEVLKRSLADRTPKRAPVRGTRERPQARRKAS
jgi:DNA end-binding protein Ku